MNRETLMVDLAGWVGTILYLVAYFLVSIKKVEGDSVSFQVMNIIAGILLVINTLYWRAYPSLGLNVAWIAIGLLTLSRRYLGDRDAG